MGFFSPSENGQGRHLCDICEPRGSVHSSEKLVALSVFYKLSTLQKGVLPLSSS